MNTFVTLYLIGAFAWTGFDLLRNYFYVNATSRPYFIGYLVTNVLLWWIALPLSFFEDAPSRLQHRQRK